MDRNTFIEQRQKQRETVTKLRNIIGLHKDDSELVQLINKQVQYLEKKFTPTTESKQIQSTVVSSIVEQITGKKIILETEVIEYPDDKKIISEEDGKLIRNGNPIPLDSSASPISITSEQIDDATKNIINVLITQLNKFKDDPSQAQQLNSQNTFLQSQSNAPITNPQYKVDLTKKQQVTESELDVDPDTPDIITQETVDSKEIQRKVLENKDNMSYEEWDQLMFDVMFGDDDNDGISNETNLRSFTSSDQTNEDQVDLIQEWIEKNNITEEKLKDKYDLIFK